MSRVHRRLVCFTDPAEQNLEMVRRELHISRSQAVRRGLDLLCKKLAEKRPLVAEAAEGEDRK